MSPFDDFVDIPSNPSFHAAPVSSAFFSNSQGPRVFTEGLIASSIRAYHPKHHLTIAPESNCNLLAFASAHDDVTCVPHGSTMETLMDRMFFPPARRYGDEAGGGFGQRVVFGCYEYKFKGEEFLVYVVEGLETPFMKTRNSYILVDETKVGSEAEAREVTDGLIKDCTNWSLELHNEVLVFDGGFWQKSAELWQNIQNANWEDVILEKEKKEGIINDVLGFFDAEERYKEFGVPWKRGVIFYGPPGNGKTISTKALMHDISKRTSPHIESLYIKTLSSFQGPEYSIRQIFLKARQMAPCILIFEDIDSLVTPFVRSYFLNEVDGLESNHGILMIGSTNHLEQLDPGIAKRPSRFDRKYLFDDPTKDERAQYAEYWRHKLRGNKKVDFPKELCGKIAEITQNFSFAYMKEAFVATLMLLVGKGDKESGLKSREDDFSGSEFWQEFKRQVENLRREMEDDDMQAVWRKKTGGIPQSVLGLSNERSLESRPKNVFRGGFARQA